MAPQESNITHGTKRQSQLEDLFTFTVPAKRKRKKKKGIPNDVNSPCNQSKQSAVVPEVITLDSDDSEPKLENQDEDVILVESPIDEIDLSTQESTKVDDLNDHEDDIVININQTCHIDQLLPSETPSTLHNLPPPLDPESDAPLSRSVTVEDYPKSWTKDMIDYYTKPCETNRNFDYEKLIRKMKTKPADWYINPADKYGLGKQRRNYQPCRKCRRSGVHLEKECKKNMVCYICGEFNHIYLRCPNTLCLTCGTRTSKNITSCNSCQLIITNKKPCSLCGQLYHTQEICPSRWRQFSVLSDSTQPAKPNTRKFCYNCAEKGHFGFECTLTPYSEYPLENPFITSLLNRSPPTNKIGDDNNANNAVIPLSQETANLLKSEKGSLFLKQFSNNQNIQVEFLFGSPSYPYVKFIGQKEEATVFRRQLNEFKIQVNGATRA